MSPRTLRRSLACFLVVVAPTSAPAFTDDRGLHSEVIDALALVADAGPEAGGQALEALLSRPAMKADLMTTGVVLWGLMEARRQQGRWIEARELAEAIRALEERMEGTAWQEEPDREGAPAETKKRPAPILRAGYMATLAEIEAAAGRLDDALRHVDTAIREMDALRATPWAAEMAAGLRIGRAGILDLLYHEPEAAARDLQDAARALESSRRWEALPEGEDPLPAVVQQLEALQAAMVGDEEAAIAMFQEIGRTQRDDLPPDVLDTLDLLARMKAKGPIEVVGEVVSYCCEIASGEARPTIDPAFLVAHLQLCAMTEPLIRMGSEGRIRPEGVHELLRIVMEMADTVPGPHHETLSRMILEMLDLLGPPRGPEEWPSTEELLGAIRARRSVHASVPPTLRAGADSALALFIQLAATVRARAGDAAGSLALAEEGRARVFGDQLDSTPVPAPGATEGADPDLERAEELQALAEAAMDRFRPAEALRHVDAALALVEGEGHEVTEAGLRGYRGAILAALQDTEHAEEEMEPLMDLLEQEVSRRKKPEAADSTPLVEALPGLLLSSSTGRFDAGLEQLRELQRRNGDLLPPSLAKMLEMVSHLEAQQPAQAAVLCREVRADLEAEAATVPESIAASLDMMCGMVDFLATLPDEGPAEPTAVAELFATVGRSLDSQPGPFQEPLQLLLEQIAGMPDAVGSSEEWPSSDDFQPVLERLEETVAGAAPPGLRAGLDGTFNLFPQLAVTIRSEAGDAGGSFELSERARARELLDRLTDAHVAGHDDRQQERTIALLRERRDELQRQIKDAAWTDPGSGETERLVDELRTVNRDLDDAFRRLALEREESERAEPLSLGEIQTRLGDDTTLVAYLTFSLEEEPLAWVVDGDEVHLVPLDVEPQRLEAEVRLFNRRLRDGLPVEDLAERLYSVLWAPVAAEIETRRVLVVPHGPLQELPFAALRDPATGRWLMESATLFYAPSASAWARLHSRVATDTGRPLVLADPDGDLPEARREARDLAALWNVRPHVGKEASEAALRAAVATAPLVHVSSHGVLSLHEPFFSYLKLAPSADGGNDPRQDGRLELHEVMEELDLKGTSLVVLPACHSAEGPRTRGDEVTSLARAFLLAGARSAVTTAWAVDDSAAATVMVDFHRHLAAGTEAAEALRLAQMAILGSGDHSHPSRWAAFALHGAGGVLPRAQLSDAEPEADPQPPGP